MLLDDYILATLGPRWDWIETRQVALGITLLVYGLGKRATLKMALPLSLNEVNTLRQSADTWSRTEMRGVRLEGRQVVNGVTLDVRPMEGAPPDSDLLQVIARVKAHAERFLKDEPKEAPPVEDCTTAGEGTDLEGLRARFRAPAT